MKVAKIMQFVFGALLFVSCSKPSESVPNLPQEYSWLIGNWYGVAVTPRGWLLEEVIEITDEYARNLSLYTQENVSEKSALANPLPSHRKYSVFKDTLAIRKSYRFEDGRVETEDYYYRLDFDKQEIERYDNDYDGKEPRIYKYQKLAMLPDGSIKDREKDLSKEDQDVLIQKAEEGNLQAQRLLAIRYQRLGQYDSAIKCYLEATGQGDGWGEYYLGCSYYYGRGVPQDYAIAVEWFTKAAKFNHAEAQFFLGYCYEEGLGGNSKNAYRAAEWYTKAAEQGLAVAQCNIGLCYLNGKGVEQNRTKAIDWLRKAAIQGNGNAKNVLKDIGATY